MPPNPRVGGHPPPERIGMVNRTLPHAQLMPFVHDYARDMAANRSPTSMAIMKRQIYEDRTEILAHADEQSFDLMLESFGRPDFEEGREIVHAEAPTAFSAHLTAGRGGRGATLGR